AIICNSTFLVRYIFIVILKENIQKYSYFDHKRFIFVCQNDFTIYENNYLNRLNSLMLIVTIIEYLKEEIEEKFMEQLQLKVLEKADVAFLQRLYNKPTIMN